MENPGTAVMIKELAESLVAHMGGSQEAEEGNAAAEAITPEMSMKMMENAPLRPMRSFMGMKEAELDALIQKLQDAVV